MNEMTTLAPPGVALIPENMDQAMRLAAIMASSKLVPKHLHGDTGSCLMVIEQAMRWRASPFAVAQCTSNIGGKLCYEGKLIAAILPSCGATIGEFNYEYHGDPKQPDTLSVTVSAKRASDGEVKTLDLSWQEAKTTNAYWLSQPEQQLCYAGARVWARRWTPGPLLGIYAPEEWVVERRPVPKQPAADEHTGTTIDGTAEEPKAEPPPRPTVDRSKWSDAQWTAWLVRLRDACGVLYRRSEVDEVGKRDSVGDAIAKGPDWVKRDIDEILAEAYGRFPAEASSDGDELPPIKGEDKLAAG